MLLFGVPRRLDLWMYQVLRVHGSVPPFSVSSSREEDWEDVCETRAGLLEESPVLWWTVGDEPPAALAVTSAEVVLLAVSVCMLLSRTLSTEFSSVEELVLELITGTVLRFCFCFCCCPWMSFWSPVGW